MAKEIKMLDSIVDEINKTLIQAQKNKQEKDAKDNLLSIQKVSENLLSMKIILFLNNDMHQEQKQSIKKHIQKVMGLSAVKVIELGANITSMYTLQLKDSDKYFKGVDSQQMFVNRINPMLMEGLVKKTNPDIALFFSKKNNIPLFNITGLNISKTAITLVAPKDTETTQEEQSELETRYSEIEERMIDARENNCNTN